MAIEDMLARARLAGTPSGGTTIFTQMSALAVSTGALNLGQGFPDVSGPPELQEAAIAAIKQGHNQYPPMPGVPVLRQAIAEHQQHYYGLSLDPGQQVLVTAGASEGLAATMLALIQPGDEVLVLEPFFDLYAAAIALAGGTMVPVRLQGPEYAFDPAVLEAAISDRTRAFLINTPNNPAGTMLSLMDLQAIERIAVRHDLLVITDEVYEHITFDGVPHIPPATLPGLAPRTVSVSSAGKSLSMTGWKIGWVTGAPELIAAIAAVKQWLSFASGTPFQHAIASVLTSDRPSWDELRISLQSRRDLLAEGLVKAGYSVNHPHGAYFLIADISRLTDLDADAFCRQLPYTQGVVAVPLGALYLDATAASSLVRFTFCKREEVLREAVDRLQPAT